MQLLKLDFNLLRSLKYGNTHRTLFGLRQFCDEKPERPDLYRTLGLKSSASSSEIKKAYYDLTLKYHPDRNEDNVAASTKFREVTEAYEILGNYALRKRYDKGLPLPSLTSDTSSKKPIVEVKVKYQSFYDSRSKPLKFETKTPPIGEKIQEPEDYDPRLRAAEASLKADRGAQGIIGLFITGVLFYAAFYSKK